MSIQIQEEPQKNKWFVEHPLSLYNEDVKKLAKDNGLQIVDMKYINEPIGDFKRIGVPDLTLVGSKVVDSVASLPQITSPVVKTSETRKMSKEELEEKYGIDQPKVKKPKSVKKSVKKSAKKKSSKKKSVKKKVGE